jgi:hypothetical protein
MRRFIRHPNRCSCASDCSLCQQIQTGSGPTTPTIQWVSGHLSVQSGWQSAQVGHFCLVLGVWAMNLPTQTLTTLCLIIQKNMVNLIASKVGTVTKLREDKAKCPGSIPGRDKRLFSFHNHSKQLWTPPTSYSLGAGSFSWREVK